MGRLVGSLMTGLAVAFALVPAEWFALGLGFLGVALGAVAIVRTGELGKQVESVAEQLRVRAESTTPPRGGDGGDR